MLGRRPVRAADPDLPALLALSRGRLRGVQGAGRVPAADDLVLLPGHDPLRWRAAERHALGPLPAVPSAETVKAKATPCTPRTPGCAKQAASQGPVKVLVWAGLTAAVTSLLLADSRLAGDLAHLTRESRQAADGV